MALKNLCLPHRPLLAGLAISSEEKKVFGTLGCFAESADGALWGITARHVLSDANAPALVSVFQSDCRKPAHRISDDARPPRMAGGIDAIAFALSASTSILPEVLELGRWSAPAAPHPGMTVWKMGCATGLTVAVIGDVGPYEFEVVPRAGMPSGYSTFASGDSGAVWFTRDGMQPVGIHIAQSPISTRGAAVRLDTWLMQAGLWLLQ